MRKTAFYPKLAWQNIRRNRQFYLPFLLTCIATAAMFYIMCFLTFNGGMEKMRGAAYISFMMQLGCYVIAFFSTIFLFYTNSFLMKRRRKELGLYNILGMGKGNLAVVLFLETLYTALLTLTLGLGLGILLSKLMLLILMKLIGFAVPFGFEISVKGILYSVCLFCFIFALILISSLIRIRLSNPIELLHGSSVGEKEPKTKTVLAVLGVLTLGVGYYIAIVTQKPLTALLLFFVAVILVIIGTYLLFTAGSIAVLKKLRNKKDYYYTTSHFIPVSGMIYRMKQNAVGLANICILATMVLVMVSGTVCLYLGTEDTLKVAYPTEIVAEIARPDASARAAVTEAIGKAVSSGGEQLSNVTDFLSLSFTCKREGTDFGDSVQQYTTPDDDSVVRFLPASEYARLTGDKAAISDGEAYAYSDTTHIIDRFSSLGKTFNVARWVSALPSVSEKASIVTDHYFFVVTDSDFKALSSSASEVSPLWYYGFDIGGTAQQQISCRDAVDAAIKSAGVPENSVNVYSRASDRSDSYAMNGGFLFLGLFLGLVFLIATVLIIYYKQLSEGYDDRERFEIMQQVGLSRPEIRKAIRSQILVVFFLPLGTAVVHICFAFKLITRLLLVLNLTNTGLFALCTLGTVLLFALIYWAVYMLTAKVYYRIVS